MQRKRHATLALLVEECDLNDKRQNVCRHSVGRRMTTSPQKTLQLIGPTVSDKEKTYYSIVL
jgi:hypothetical protein